MVGLLRRRVETAEGDGQVVGDHARLVIGDVLELPVAGHVAERPDALDAGALLCVDDHVALLVEGDAAGGDVEPVTIGDPPRRQQDDVGVDGCAPLRPGDLQLPRAGLGAVRGVHPVDTRRS